MTWRSLADWLVRPDRLTAPVQTATPEQLAGAWKAGFLASRHHLLTDIGGLQAERDYWKARYELEHTVLVLTTLQTRSARFH